MMWVSRGLSYVLVILVIMTVINFVMMFVQNKKIKALEESVRQLNKLTLIQDSKIDALSGKSKRVI